MRFLCLQYLNQHLLYLLPIINLLSTHSTSLAARLCKLSNLMFYDHKITFLHHVINASARRAVDQAPPEIKLDPLEVIGDHSTVKLSDSQFCQAVQQLVTIPSQQLCVRLASGGDPTYAFNVKMAGEEVHGTSKGLIHKHLCTQCTAVYIYHICIQTHTGVCTCVHTCTQTYISNTHACLHTRTHTHIHTHTHTYTHTHTNKHTHTHTHRLYN